MQINDEQDIELPMNRAQKSLFISITRTIPWKQENYNLSSTYSNVHSQNAICNKFWDDIIQSWKYKVNQTTDKYVNEATWRIILDCNNSILI